MVWIRSALEEEPGHGLVLAVDGDVVHGSGRSISAFDLLGALESCSDVFLRFGGHRQAAGVTLEAARVPELRRRLAAIAGERLSPEDLIPRLRIDAPLGLREISSEVIEGLGRLGPFGAANPKPVFRAAPVELLEAPKRIKDRHLSLLLKQDGRAFRAIAWRAAEREEYLSVNRFGLEVAYSLDPGEYQGEATTEMTVADLRIPRDLATPKPNEGGTVAPAPRAFSGGGLVAPELRAPRAFSGGG